LTRITHWARSTGLALTLTVVPVAAAESAAAAEPAGRVYVQTSPDRGATAAHPATTSSTYASTPGATSGCRAAERIRPAPVRRGQGWSSRRAGD
jgi:hypothetical protein